MINKLRVLDINDALLEGAAPFRTLKDISIEFDDNKNCIYAYERDHCLVQAYYDKRAVVLKINLNDAKEEDVYSDIYLENRLFKEELKVINIRNKEVFVDVLMIDDEPRELLSFITPNAENKDLITAFIAFLTSLHTEQIVVEGLSFDSCFFLKDRVLLSPVRKCKTRYVGDTEGDLIAEFRNFTANMFVELLLEIEGIKSADYDCCFKAGQNIPLEENRKLLRESGSNYYFHIDRLLFAANRGEIIDALNERVSGTYSEDRVASYDPTSEKWGYLNLKGEVKIPFLYDTADAFYEDIAVVKKDGYCGSIDRSGKQCLDFTFRELSWQGRYNSYIFKKKSFFGIMDRNGKVILDERYLHIGTFNDGCAVVQSPESLFFGAVNTLGEVVIEPVYDNIEPFKEMRTTATKDGVRVVLDIFGDKI